MSIIFVACFYGIGMPILFPLSALALFSTWCSERFFLAKEIRLPPKMNDLLITNAISWLKFAPLVFLINGTWMIGNK